MKFTRLHMSEKLLKNASFNHSSTILNKKASIGAFLKTVVPELKSV